MSRSFAWTRWSGLAAVWGGVLGAAGSILAAAAYYNLDWNRADAPGWAQAVQALLVKAADLRRSGPGGPGVWAGFPAGLPASVGGSVGPGSLLPGAQPDNPRAGFRLALIGLILMAFGSLADYWTGPAGAFDPRARQRGLDVQLRGGL